MESQITCSSSTYVPKSTYKSFKQLADMAEGENWMTRVMISRTWNEVDFLGTNEVQTFDLLMIDENGDQLHGVVPKKIIWKFEPLLHEGVVYSLSKLSLAAEKKIFRPARNEKRAFFEWNTMVRALDSTDVKIPRHKFSFTAFEELESCSSNTYLTDVVGVLTSHTTLQEINKANGQRSIMRDLNLQNLSGVNVKITLWGDATSELSRNLDQHGIEPAPVIVVVTGCYVKKISKFMLRFEVQEHTNSTIFVALDSEVQKIVKAPASEVLMMGEVEGKARVMASFNALLGVEKDY
ncbi:replication protein A 70 kDa DNA-binding subunit A-like [Papaver somniferum]|uniref:replication protein A 70 kDa DNA-binding subunit A-like n=1 Tax=Papaver somniferum TaxID=3469 RepID=UPI000E6FCE53|nr:replication protein A 70 kDa DNA-binding subunit A-like [Papaver somniferum]